jgi:hypothetical protein
VYGRFFQKPELEEHEVMKGSEAIQDLGLSDLNRNGK